MKLYFRVTEASPLRDEVKEHIAVAKKTMANAKRFIKKHGLPKSAMPVAYIGKPVFALHCDEDMPPPWVRVGRRGDNNYRPRKSTPEGKALLDAFLALGTYGTTDFGYEWSEKTLGNGFVAFKQRTYHATLSWTRDQFHMFLTLDSRVYAAAKKWPDGLIEARGSEVYRALGHGD